MESDTVATYQAAAAAQPEFNMNDILGALNAPETMNTNFAYSWYNDASITGMWYLNKDYYQSLEKKPQFIVLKSLPVHRWIWYHVLPNFTAPLEEGKILAFANAKPETTHLKYRKRDGNTVRLSPDSERARPSTEVLMGVNDPYTESYYKNLYNIPAAVDENRAELRCFKWRDFSQPLQPKRGIFPPPSATHY